ncbi:FIG138056: a glutathione-dependent thiol reductase [hydrothermal vent metagenome]|uniref:FIG138056: a glutathione-dependent thiol reductase n=1 Tax=hydrothermal vent metagenome TaxID=652676 RepID=A0A3B0YFA9_9ZZZZ
MPTLFGITSCDTIRKAKQWLTQHNVDFEFHDYKKKGVPEKALKQWIKQVGWEVLLNKRGTTWRKLDDSIKESVDEKSAIQIMLNNPSIIKRPVLDIDGQYQVGFSDQAYQALF